jgi:small subunit ribosomal protein S16
VAVKIKLKRMGKIHAPFYRIIVADARTKRDGRAIEEIGKYHPKNEPSFIEVDSERAQHWLSVGAQPTDPVRKILEITGDWQKFKGLPGAEGTLRTAAPKPDKKDAYAAAVSEAVGTGDTGKGKGRKPGAKADGDQADADGAKAGSGRSAGRSGGRQAAAKGGKADAPKADAPKADAPKADAPKADAPKADAPTADTAAADSAPADAVEDEKPAKASTAKASAEKASTAKASTEKASTDEASTEKVAVSAEAEPVAEQSDGA